MQCILKTAWITKELCLLLWNHCYKMNDRVVAAEVRQSRLCGSRNNNLPVRKRDYLQLSLVWIIFNKGFLLNWISYLFSEFYFIIPKVYWQTAVYRLYSLYVSLNLLISNSQWQQMHSWPYQVIKWRHFLKYF